MEVEVRQRKEEGEKMKEEARSHTSSGTCRPVDIS